MSDPTNELAGTPLNAPAPVDIKPIHEQLTLEATGDGGPTSGDGRPDAFIVGDQTAAGALTPEGGRNPGEPAGIPGINGNVLDPHNVNGTIGNQAVLDAGHGLENPALREDAGDDAAEEKAETEQEEKNEDEHEGEHKDD
jgi:hypothetical protein